MSQKGADEAFSRASFVRHQELVIEGTPNQGIIISVLK